MAKKRAGAWLDPRLVIGVVLVSASVAGVLGVVSAVSRTETMYVASAPLLPGELITASQLDQVQVRIEPETAAYLKTDNFPVEGLIVVRPVLKGELVPIAALGRVEGTRLTSIVVDSTGGLPAAVEPGSAVEVWSTSNQRQSQEGGGVPSILVESAYVARVHDQGGLMSTRGVTEVELLVPRDSVSSLLAAMAEGDIISLVPVSLPVGE